MTRVLLFFISLSVPAAAWAQDHPVFELRTAFGISNYLHGDLDYTAPTWLVGVRVGSGAMAFEPEFAYARHDDAETFGIGSASPTVETSSTTYKSFAVNIVGRWGSRASGYVGGGAGLYSEDHRFRQANRDRVFENTRNQGPRAGAQLVGGVDIPVASRIKAFAQGRYEIRSFEDPGGGSVVQGFVGVAFTIR
jgi:hypothetical protein